ncbi:hypothetical protein FEE96_01630 [Parasedimentitalea maritima]|uniref:Uncharacterized protein n=1 Tax=Parasedimentitalea maritima TaxID=2578117 RepID=A0ABY2V5J7_9RHOB|nr:hypothetical protein [Zongyanglinia marina]TLP69014.1 hypothetical protein FEE96_01630 [Zongyanglinia marina]
MGLAVTVGILIDLLSFDPEGADWFRNDMDAVNATLSEVGIESHVEPTEGSIFSAEMFGYSGLHALREVAGLVWQGKAVPQNVMLDGSDTHAGATLFSAILDYYNHRKGEQPPFAHLVFHGDAAGYYVPVDFPLPVAPEVMDEEFAHLWPVGSVQGLQAELNTLAQILQVPDEMTSGAVPLDDWIADWPPEGDAPIYLFQPVATYSLLVLRDASAYSLKTNAAIGFE